MKQSAHTDEHDTTFANEFRAAREAAGLTQAEAADILRVARRAIQQWEGKLREPIYPAQFGALVILRGYRATLSKK